MALQGIIASLFLCGVFSQIMCQSDVLLYSNTCPLGQTALDCNYIQQNADAICPYMDADTVGNGEACSLFSNCTYGALQPQINNVFCCSAYAPTTSPVTTGLAVATQSASTTCAYRTFDSYNDFSGIQGKNGWYYGYYNDGMFNPFTSYAVSSTGSAEPGVISWNYNVASNGFITDTLIMPNGAGACNTASYGNIAPVLRWYIPPNSCYNDVTVTLNINKPSGNGNGVNVLLTMNGNTVYSGAVTSAISFTNVYNGYDINSVELTVSPNSNACDYAQTDYRLTIAPMGTSNTAVNTRTSLASPTPTRSAYVSGLASGTLRPSDTVLESSSSTASPSVSISPKPSYSMSLSPTVTSTVFYYGNWSDMGQFNYPNGDITSYYSGLTLNQCKINCWQNPLCGVIVVASPCTNIDPHSNEANSVVCSQCWLKYTSGWSGPVTDTSNHGYMLPERVYPSTRTSASTLTNTQTSVPTTTLQMDYSFNMCISSGNTFTLPTIGSSVNLITNTIGTRYVDNLNCGFNINGWQPGKMLTVSFNSFATESCCDFIRIYSLTDNSLLYSFSGTSIPATINIQDNIRVVFSSDLSVVMNGVQMNIRLVNGPGSVTSSATATAIPSRASLSGSFSSSASGSFGNSDSASSSASASYSSSLSCSASKTVALSSSSSISQSMTASTSETPSYSSKPSDTKTARVTSSSSSSLSVSGTVSNSVSKTNVYTVSSLPSVSKTASIFGTRTGSSSFTLSKTPTASYVYRPKIALAPVLPANLEALSTEQLSDAITDLGNYDPKLVQNNLQLLGAAALFKMSEPLVISTDTFSLTMAKLDNNSALPITTDGLNVVMPVIDVPGAAATSIIKWTDNPYINKTVLDSHVVSMSVLNKGGREIGISNLTTPITLHWDLDIKHDDPRIASPPSYMAMCTLGDIYVKNTNNGVLSKMEISGAGKSFWNVPCLMGTMAWVNCSDDDIIKNYDCPVAKLVPRCMYWSVQQNKWAEDGCRAVTGNSSSIVCECDHLTDFSARLDAVVSENAAIFLNAGDVYSVAGLLKYAKWYGIFGGIGLIAFLLGLIVSRVDYLSTQKYVKAVCLNKDVSRVLESVPHTPIFAYDALSTLQETDRRLKVKYVPPHLNLCQRILIQHSRLQFLFRYDPRLSRLFRLLGILLLQLHSLFVTALFYGFTYGAGGKDDMKWYDVILLAGLTTALNIPVVKIIMDSMNYVGISEFQAQFPILYAEYMRRLAFEKLALVYLYRKKGIRLEDKSDSGNDVNLDMINNSRSSDFSDFANDDNSLLDAILLYFCCKSKRNHDEEELEHLNAHQLMRKMATLIKESYPYIEAYSNVWGLMPFHTRYGFFFTLGCIGWIVWCLNYLLLFAAAHSSSVGENIMMSYATSEITTVFLTQPLIIGVSYVFYKMLSKYGKYLPTCIYNRLVVTSVRSIPSLYYFSDPFGRHAKTSFSSEFSYNLFVRCPAAAMGATEEAYAPQKAIASGEDPAERTIVGEIKRLYFSFIDTWDNIMHR